MGLPLRSTKETTRRLALAALLLAAPARASNVTEFPDNGSEMVGRGGAWVARASDPLAAFYNPAGLAGQKTAVSLQLNTNFRKTCFTRLRASADTSVEPSGFVDATGHFPEVCSDFEPFPNPQIAATLAVSDKVGVGFALLGPSVAGKATFPDTLSNNGTEVPAPQRYLLLNSNLLFLYPTIAIGAEIAPRLRLGASLQWGIMKAKFASSSMGINRDAASARDNDVHATLIVADYFVPGGTLGALYSPTDVLDIGGFFRVSDSIRASGDVYTQVNYFSDKAAKGNGSTIKDGDSSMPNCNDPTAVGSPCGSGSNAKVTLAVPMEAKLGARFHVRAKGRDLATCHQRDFAPGTDAAAITRAIATCERELMSSRDPMHDDLFDVEVDLTWANNSSIDNLEVRFPGNNGQGTIPVNGIAGGVIPPNADIPRNYRDVFGVRLGGDYNVVQDTLAVRAGGYFESQAERPEYQNLDFIGSWRLGFGLGGTYRLPIGPTKTDKKGTERRSAIDVSLAFSHVFVGTSENEDPSSSGVRALAGTACNPAGSGVACPGGNPAYRSNWAVNLGKITNSVNVINLGATYRF